MEGKDEDERVEAPTESDWLFEYVDSVMKSPSWDSEIMGFIDDNCMVFDNEEENKFEHTVVHEKFQELVDGLLSNNLSEVSVSPEAFAEACERARFASRSNRGVFEQLMAMTDFLTFKKLMVKRNMELELEAVQELQRAAIPIIAPGDEDEAEKLYQMALKESAEMSAAEARAVLDKARRDKAAMKAASKQTRGDDSGKAADDEDVDEGGGRPGSSGRKAAARLDLELRQAMDLALMELEMQNKQLEVEQQELEQAIAMSLFVEQERMRLAMEEAEEYQKEAEAAEEAWRREYAGDRSRDGTGSDEERASTGSAEPDFSVSSTQGAGRSAPTAVDTSPGGQQRQPGPRAEAKGCDSPVARPSSSQRAEGAGAGAGAGSAKDADNRDVAAAVAASVRGGWPASGGAEAKEGRGGAGPLGDAKGSAAAVLADALKSLDLAEPVVAEPMSKPRQAASAKGLPDDDDAPTPSAAASFSRTSAAPSAAAAEKPGTTSSPSCPSSSSSSLSSQSSLSSAPSLAMSAARASLSAAAADDALTADYSAPSEAVPVLKEKKKKKKDKDRDKPRDASTSAAASGLQPLGGGGGSGGMGKGLAPLPSISELQAAMNKRKAEAEAAFKRNQAALDAQKAVAADLGAAAGVTAEDNARRAEYLKDQRDRLVAKKRAERESKAKAYDDDREQSIVAIIKENAGAAAGGGGGGEAKAGSSDEERRAMMRVALARRMKDELTVSEAERLRIVQEEQYGELDAQLRLVEDLRSANRRKEADLGRQLKAQQEQRFRNLQTSVAEGAVGLE